ncbi:MAG: helix-turn-helix domain-containing protein [Patescibacteria group bacterium]
MKQEKLQKVLEQMGLSEHEAAVYLSALSLGPSPILALARGSGVKRTTVYSVLTSLQKKGLMIREVRGWKTLFAAERPEKLEAIIESKKTDLARALPDLSALYNLRGEEGTIRFYDGLEAVKSVYESLIKDVKPHEDYLIVSDLSQWLSLDPEFFQNFVERRAKLPINIRMLAQPSEIARQHKKHERAYNESVRFLPEGTKLTTNLVIIPKRVVIHQLVEPVFAMTIENPSIIRLHREQFEIMWKALPEAK